MSIQELGGNAACVIEDFREGELEAMVPKLIFGAFYQSGQSCISVQRCLIRQVRALWRSICEQRVMLSL